MKGDTALYWTNDITCFFATPQSNLIVYTKSSKDFCLFQGAGTDEETLIEVLCSRSNDELVEIKKVYKECRSKTSQAFT